MPASGTIASRSNGPLPPYEDLHPSAVMSSASVGFGLGNLGNFGNEIEVSARSPNDGNGNWDGPALNVPPMEEELPLDQSSLVAMALVKMGMGMGVVLEALNCKYILGP